MSEEASEYILEKIRNNPKINEGIYYELGCRPLLMKYLGEITESYHKEQLEAITEEERIKSAQVFASGNLVLTNTKQESSKHVFHCYEWGWKDCLKKLKEA